MGEQRHCCSWAVDDLIVGKQSRCNDLQAQVQGLGNKDLTCMAKDLKSVLKDSLRPRTPITAFFMLWLVVSDVTADVKITH